MWNNQAYHVLTKNTCCFPIGTSPQYKLQNLKTAKGRNGKVINRLEILIDEKILYFNWSMKTAATFEHLFYNAREKEYSVQMLFELGIEWGDNALTITENSLMCVDPTLFSAENKQ